MKKKQILGILAVCLILVITGAIGVYSAITMNKMKKESEKSMQKSLQSLLGGSESSIALPQKDFIGQINIVGTIAETSSVPNSLSDGTEYRHDYYLKYIDTMEQSKYNKGIFLYVNSPGGTVYASDELYLRLMKYKENTGRPVYAYFASEACSGAYYISMAADKIYANRNCWTGSIGVIISLMNYEELMKKIGVSEIDITTGANKTIGSAAHEMTKEQRQIFQSLVDEAYEQFTGIVADGRKLDIATVKKLADGRIYSAKQAKEQKLVDEIMGLEETKGSVADTLGNKDILFFEPKNNQFDAIFNRIFGKASLFQNKSEIQAAKEMMDQDESGVLMYYAK